MVRIGVSSMFFHDCTLPDIFDLTESAGCSSLEFWPETPDFWLRGLPCEELSGLTELHKALFPITLHTPVLDLNPCSINPDVAEISLEWTCRTVEMAEIVSASLVTIHPGRRTTKRPPSRADHLRLEHYLAEVSRCARQRGVSVSIENMEKKVNSLLSSPEEIQELLTQERWLHFTLDIAHAMRVSEKEACRYIDLCFDRIANVHVSAAGKKKTHLPVSTSKEAEEVISYLAGCGYQGPLTLEMDDMNFSPRLSPIQKAGVLERERIFIEKCLE